MTEKYEFRVLEKYADLLFAPNEGKRLGVSGLFRKVLLSENNPKFRRVGELYRSILKEHNEMFFLGWDIYRDYTTDELAKAELLLVHHISKFEPAGEERGTEYDDASACHICRAGAKQISSLFLNWNRIPRGKDIARTIAGEVVVSKRFVELCTRYSVTGAEFRPIRTNPASSAQCKEWFQLVVEPPSTEVIDPTKFGLKPFEDDVKGEYICPMGDLIGLARLSEIWVSRRSYTGLDIVQSKQFAGVRRGLLRPERFLFLSQKVRKIIEGEKLKGFKIEVAHPA
jgi:hypothetical protein